MTDRRFFSELIAEAVARPLVGWDLSCDGRIQVAEPWDFAAMVEAQARSSPDLLDLGTGGGEWLARLGYRPPCTIATEGWLANVSVARQRLQPLGVPVVPVESAPDNVVQCGFSPGGALPFPDGAFRLVVSRHESYRAEEVRRVLARGGVFLTQQVASGSEDDFYRLLGLPVPDGARRWTLSFAAAQLEKAELIVERCLEAFAALAFQDVGALAWYLHNHPFVLPGFSIDQALPKLAELHTDGAVLSVRQPRFLVRARRPS